MSTLEHRRNWRREYGHERSGGDAGRRNRTGHVFQRRDAESAESYVTGGPVMEWDGKPGEQSELRSDAQGGALCHWAPTKKQRFTEGFAERKHSANSGKK